MSTPDFDAIAILAIENKNWRQLSARIKTVYVRALKDCRQIADQARKKARAQMETPAAAAVPEFAQQCSLVAQVAGAIADDIELLIAGSS